MRPLMLMLLVLLAKPAFAQIDQLAEVDVLAHPVARGALLGADDFTRGQINPAIARGALRAQDAIGKVATRNLMAGSSLHASDIASPSLVRRGEAVTLVLASGALRISAPGRALSDGARGAPVRVVNLATSHTLDGTVEGSGQVRIAAN